MPEGSLSAQNFGVIIAIGDPLSEAVGAYYANIRGIPPQNVIHVSLNTGSVVIAAAQLADIKAQVDMQLPANVQATLLTWSEPTQVATTAANGNTCNMSITSAFAMGVGGDNGKFFCQTTGTGVATSAYYNSSSRTPWQDFGMRPSMMLGAITFDQARALIDRGVSADATYPNGDGYLIRTSDATRSIPRYFDFSKLPALWADTNGINLQYIDNSKSLVNNAISSDSNILFYFTGLAKVPSLATNSYRPGAVGDTLTSFGGILPTSSQTNVAEWIAAGLTGSYGTVEEPFALSSKFPVASIVIDHYFRGETLIESYWKSVAQPGEGLFVGEPLARPFLDPLKSDLSTDGTLYQFSTRALRRNSRYVYEYQPANKATGNWAALGAITTPNQVPAQRPYSLPVPPVAATAVRVLGPCSTTDPFNMWFSGFGRNTVPTIQMTEYSYPTVAVELIFDNIDNGPCNDAVGKITVKSNFTRSLYKDLASANLNQTANSFTFIPQPGKLTSLKLTIFVTNGLTPGIYPQTLTLTNAYGETQTKTINIQVVPETPTMPIRTLAPNTSWYVPLKPTSGSNSLPPYSSLIVSAISDSAYGWHIRFTLIDSSTGATLLQTTLPPNYANTLYTTSLDLTPLGKNISPDLGIPGCLCQMLVEIVDNHGNTTASQLTNDIEIY